MSIRTRRNLTRASLREAIEYLASACDGAVRRDGHGFSATHVAVGHGLAAKASWAPHDIRRARRIAIHHKRQLSAAGLFVRGLDRPAKRPRTKAQWAPDPTRVHSFRYWNGTRWTALTQG